MNERVLVTGASGFVGQTLCYYLASKKFAVCASARKHQNYPVGVKSVSNGALSADTDWSIALSGVDVVVHLAARVHIMRDAEFDPLTVFCSFNVDGTLNLARQAVKAGCKRFIFISSIGVNGSQTNFGQLFTEFDKASPHNAYALSKWVAEQNLMQLADETGLEVVIIRPPLVYGSNAPGNFGALMRAVKIGRPLPLGAVCNKRSFVALDNLVNFIFTCIIHPQAANQTLLVSDGKDLSTTELLRGMAQVAGLPARLVPLPVWALRAGASLLGKGDAVQRLCGNLQVDISKARSLLGWVPPVSVEEGLRRAMAA